MNEQIITPTIHLNGTIATRLLEPLSAAFDKLEEAYAALKETAPNGRDYYVQGDHAMGRAVNEHMKRLARIDAVKAEVEMLILAIEVQVVQANQ